MEKSLEDIQREPTVASTAMVSFFSSIPSDVFNSVSAYLDTDLQDFVRLHAALTYNRLCRRHWREQLCPHVHRAAPLFTVFKSRKKLMWALEEGIDARDWVLQVPGVKGAATGGMFTWFCEREDIDVLRAMVQRTRVDVEAGYPGSDDTPLLWAAAGGLAKAVAFLCEQGADTGARGADGATALHRAVRYGHLAVVQYLCEQGADKEAKNSSGMTPLHLAAETGHVSMVQYLSEQGASS